MTELPGYQTDGEDQFRRIRHGLDDLERLLERLPERPRKAVCVDLILRLRLEVNKVLDDSNLSTEGTRRRS